MKANMLLGETYLTLHVFNEAHQIVYTLNVEQKADGAIKATLEERPTDEGANDK